MRVPGTPKVQQVQQIQIPQVELLIQGAQFRTETVPTGEKVLVIGPIAVQIVIPFDAAGAETLSSQMGSNSGIVIPRVAI